MPYVPLRDDAGNLMYTVDGYLIVINWYDLYLHRCGRVKKEIRLARVPTEE